MKKIVLFITLLFLACLSYCVEIPKPNGYVSDYENLFTSEQKQELINILTDYEKTTTIEIAVLTVSDYGDDIFDFAQETATKWGIGKDSTNNGLLIVISKNHKKWRFQTGYGLEGYLPDGWLKGIGDETAEEYFKKDNFYEGTINIINECKTRIEKDGGYNYDNNELLSAKHKKQTKDIITWIVIIIVIIIILCVIFPDTFGLFIISLIFGGNSNSGSSGGGFGGGGFGGGGAGGSW
ncbi:TPM domain-containing protein [Candidatus Dojkabacteria bacterium]|jgi:uncharacterized protein|nr:TPM domain-containing protein [Candidatus Dojkabacteria bacterium]